MAREAREVEKRGKSGLRGESSQEKSSGLEYGLVCETRGLYGVGLVV